MSTIAERAAQATRGTAAPAARPARTAWLAHGALAVLCLAMLAPLVWMVRTAFTPSGEVFQATLALVPEHPTLANFPLAFRLHPVALWLVNSVLVAGAITLGKLALAVPAAFAFAHLPFKGRRALFALVVGTMTVPYVVTLIPVYLAVVRVGLYDTHAGVILPSIAFCGFAIFFLRQSFLVLPQELFDAAAIDGAGPWRMLWSIALPNVRPAVASMAVLSFLGAWNLYLWPHLVLDDQARKTLSIGIKLFATVQEQEQQWGALMAAALVGVVPVLIVFVAAQRYLIAAFVSSGVKG
jgi:ABC-type glycerol-3-phosphate transport system permease component